MNDIRILIVDDEPGIRMIASRALRSEGMQTVEYDNGEKAYQAILESHFDLILLDISIDGMDGFHVLQGTRQRGINTPVLIITGNTEEYNEVFGFSLGADDYIIKPFRPSALTARVKALLRRCAMQQQSSDTLTVGPFQMVRQSYMFFKNNQELILTPKERELMQFFMLNINQVFSKEQIYTAVWRENYVDDNTIMVTIRNLRQKIEDNPKYPNYLTTVYGIGYKFSIPFSSCREDIL